MKKLSYLCLVLFTILLVQSCQEDDTVSPEENGKIVFSFNKTTTNNKSSTLKNLTTEKSVEDAVAILISIEDAGGVSVYEHERIDLININGEYLTSPVSLIPGSYSITEFIVVDALSNAIYLTPKEGSEYASYINNQLPVSFTVSPDFVENVNLEVIGTENATPEDFGYASFNFTVVGDGTFGVSASIHNPETLGFELTEATMVLKGDGTELFTKTLGAEVNYYLILGDYNTYTIEISKEGFTTNSKDFSAEEINELADAPYNAVLSNSNGSDSFTMVTDQTQGLNDVSIFFNVFLAEIDYQIDWGDGNIESYAADFSEIRHTYVEQQIYTITILGEADNINSILVPDSNITEVTIPAFVTQANFGDNLISSIDLSSNINLGQLFLYNNQISSIDVTNLDQLTYLHLGQNQLQSIDVSNNISLTGLILSDNQLLDIDVSLNTQLQTLIISNNSINSIDVSANPLIDYLLLQNNQLNSLDVTNNPLLKTLWAQNTQLTSVDISENTELVELELSENQITEIDLTSNTKLTRLNLQNNQLTSLDISFQNELQYVYIYSNLLDVASLENVYQKLHTNAIENNITGGELYTFGNAEPSETVIDYANDLISQYSWSVQY